MLYYKIIIKIEKQRENVCLYIFIGNIHFVLFILVRYECTGVIHNPLLDQLYAFLIVPRLVVHRKKECPELRSAGSVQR